MEKCDKKEKIDNDIWLKDFQREVLKHHICNNCPKFNCKHNSLNGYLTYLIGRSRSSSINVSTQFIELVHKAVQMSKNKGSI